MNILVLKTLLIAVWSMSAIAYLPVNIYASKDLYKAEEKTEKAMSFLKATIKNSCDINLKYKVNVIRETIDLESPFKSDSYHKAYKTKFGPQKFIYFQNDMYRYLKKNNILKSHKGISFHFVDNIYGHCGFAFPTIQLKKVKSSKLKSILENNILISRTARDCGNSSRLLTHEMAHLLVQDDPAHMCGNKKCTEENILSVHRVKPVSHSPFGMGGNHMNNFGNTNPVPYTNELIPSIGREFNKSQCKSVKEFLKDYQ